MIITGPVIMYQLILGGVQFGVRVMGGGFFGFLKRGVNTANRYIKSRS